MHLLITCKIIAYPKLLHSRIDIFKFSSFLSLHFLKTHRSNCCFFYVYGRGFHLFNTTWCVSKSWWMKLIRISGKISNRTFHGAFHFPLIMKASMELIIRQWKAGISIQTNLKFGNLLKLKNISIILTTRRPLFPLIYIYKMFIFYCK